MAAKTKCPKGFIEVHCTNAYHVDKFPTIDKFSTIVNAKMISYVNVREVEIDAYRKNSEGGLCHAKKALCHIMVLGHNNGGFTVAESYEDVVKAIAKALEETT